MCGIIGYTGEEAAKDILIISMQDQLETLNENVEKLIERMTAEDIIEESLTEWLSEADENDPTRCGFPKCIIHDAFISIHGCQVCID